MSYFNSDGNQPAQTENKTETDPQNQTQDYVASIVQAKGDQWSDPQTLAKGKLEADAFIQNLEGQVTELRAELDKQDYAADLLKQLQAKQEMPPTGTSLGEDRGTKDENTTPTLGADELKNLIESTLNNRDAEAVAKGNLAVVDAKLTELFGTEVDKVMAQRSVELGMTKERLAEMAAESPAALFKLIGEEAKVEANPVVRGTLNTTADTFTQAAGERNWNYYQELRRKNRKTYFTPATQKQMMQDKIRLGDKFGN